MIPTKEKFAELAHTILQSASVARHDDRESIPYRPQMNKITGNMVSSILLQQIEYYWIHNDSKPFYKFAAPCSHELYREKDSWYEKLDVGRSEFETARDRIATKIKRKVSKREARNYRDENGRLQKADHIVLYWTDSNLVTWYEFNADLMNAYTLIHYHNFTEDDVLMYLDHMYGTIDFEAFLGLKSDNKNEDSSPDEVSPSNEFFEDLAGNAENQHFLIPESNTDTELESKDSNISPNGDMQNINQNSEVIIGVNAMRNPPNQPNHSIPQNPTETKTIFDNMRQFTATYNTLPKPVSTPKPKAVETKKVEVEVEAIEQEQPKKTRKPAAAAKDKKPLNGRAEYKLWIIAVLDLFNLSTAFTGFNYNDSTVAAYSVTAKKMRLMANEFNDRNPDKIPIEATIVRPFYDWMKKKGWKDVGQKALVERFPEYIQSISDNPTDLPYRVSQLQKWIVAEEKQNHKTVDDIERAKFQELLDIEIITHYHQLKYQIPLDELTRIERGLADGSIYNPFN